MTKMLRVGVATTAHAEKDGGKAKTTPEMQKYRELEVHERPEELLIFFQKSLIHDVPESVRLF